ncbi:MAG: hypothetical protein NTW06_04645 [Candidatus Falkowbacteria bacterium]|nr:hypothetical protein [Candidatus Falkowbacteria bacterium]
MNQKGAGLLGLLIVVSIIALLAYGSYSYWNKNKETELNNNQQVENDIKKLNQNLIELYQTKMKAKQDIEEINRKIASSSENYKE